jgi:hypothetical protein
MSDTAIKATINAIATHPENKKNGPTQVHIVTSDADFAKRIACGDKCTISQEISDAPIGAIVIVRDMSDINEYTESLMDEDTFEDVEYDIFDLAQKSDLKIINVIRHGFTPAAYGTISGVPRPADHTINTVNYEDIVANYPGYIPVNADKAITSDSMPLVNGGYAILSISGKKALGTVGDTTISESGSAITTIYSGGKTYYVSDLDNKEVSANGYMTMAEAHKSSIKKALIFTSDASNINHKKLANIADYRIIEMNDTHAVKTEFSAVKSEMDSSKNCTI